MGDRAGRTDALPLGGPLVVAVPGIIDAALNPAGDVDRDRIDAKGGERLTVRALALQIDSRARLVLSVTAPDGRIVAVFVVEAVDPPPAQ